MNPRLISILACPQCRHALHLERGRLTCENCAGSFEMRDQTALFLPEPVQIVPAEHKSNPLGAEYEMILREERNFRLRFCVQRFRTSGESAPRCGRNFACLETRRFTGDPHSFPATAPRSAISFLQRDGTWRALLVQRFRRGKMPREPKLYRAIHARIPAQPGSGIGRSELRKGSARSGGSKHVARLGGFVERSLKSAGSLPRAAKLA